MIQNTFGTCAMLRLLWPTKARIPIHNPFLFLNHLRGNCAGKSWKGLAGNGKRVGFTFPIAQPPQQLAPPTQPPRIPSRHQFPRHHFISRHQPLPHRPQHTRNNNQTKLDFNQPPPQQRHQQRQRHQHSPISNNHHHQPHLNLMSPLPIPTHPQPPQQEKKKHQFDYYYAQKARRMKQLEARKKPLGRMTLANTRINPADEDHKDDCKESRESK